MAKSFVTVSALWVRRIGDNVEVLIERDDKFYVVFREQFEGNFSEIIEARGMLNKPEDYINALDAIEAS